MTVLGTTGDGDVFETFGTRVTATVLGRVKGDNVIGFTVVLSASSETCQNATREPIRITPNDGHYQPIA